MPSISFSHQDLNHLVGKKLSIPEIEDLIRYAKGELDKEEDGEITVSLDDTNCPYLWSAEGLAMFFKGVLGIEKGIPALKLEKSDYEIIVDKAVHKVRPYITAFVAKGPALTDYALKQIIQLQEKFCESYGRKRKNASIGLYSYKKIKFPVHYGAKSPNSVSFVPLEFEHPLTLKEILVQHPKGKDYGHLISHSDVYPLLQDDNGKVLSMAPIINSNDLGKLEVGDSEFMYESTGLDLETINLGTAIFAYALQARGYKIYTIKIKYPTEEKITPEIKDEKVKIDQKLIAGLLGFDFKESEIKKLLGKARFGYDKGVVTVPPFRGDILHPFDVIEDIAVMYGYDKIEGLPMQTYTVGGTTKLQGFVDDIRTLAIGVGHQEVFSAVLSNRKLMYETARYPDPGTIELVNYMSETFSCVRTTIVPILLDFLSKNKHVDYPQKVFEEGIVTRRHGEGILDSEMLCMASSHAHTTFTEMKQAVDAMVMLVGKKTEYKELDHPTFITGRAATIVVDGTEIGMIGEVHPQVLENFGMEMPVAMLEMNLTTLFELKKA